MPRAIERWFICNGRYRIHSVKPVGGHPERIIEIEDVDGRERFHGSGSDLSDWRSRLCARELSLNCKVT